MKWSILILTQPCRKRFLDRLLGHLEPQVEKFPDVEIRIRQYVRELQLGGNRQKLLEESEADYVCFVDDDDMVADDYVERICPLLDGVDYIGFRVQCFIDGKQQAPTFHSLQHGNWSTADDRGFYRDISHVNPVLRRLALEAKYTGDCGEDARWADDMRTLGIVKTEHYIPEIMYWYYYRTCKNDHDVPYIPEFQKP